MGFPMVLCVPAGLVIEDPSMCPFVLVHHAGMCPTGVSGTFLRDTPEVQKLPWVDPLGSH